MAPLEAGARTQRIPISPSTPERSRSARIRTRTTQPTRHAAHTEQREFQPTEDILNSSHATTNKHHQISFRRQNLDVLLISSRQSDSCTPRYFQINHGPFMHEGWRVSAFHVLTRLILILQEPIYIKYYIPGQPCRREWMQTGISKNRSGQCGKSNPQV